MPSIPTLRNFAFNDQSRCCYYCGAKMWLSKPEEFANACGISSKAAERFRCTAEHLTPREEGGKDTAENIVAACRYCNSARHRTRQTRTPREHKDHVLRRLKKNRWHPPPLRGALTCR